jgi:hypothetical protein
VSKLLRIDKLRKDFFLGEIKKIGFFKSNVKQKIIILFFVSRIQKRYFSKDYLTVARANSNLISITFDLHFKQQLNITYLFQILKWASQKLCIHKSQL